MKPDGRTYRIGSATDNSKAHIGTDVCHTCIQSINEVFQLVYKTYLYDHHHKEKKTYEAYDIPPVRYLRVVAHKFRMDIIPLDADPFHPIK